MFSCKYWEISKKPILKNICVRLLLKRLQEVIDQDFLSGESLSKTSRLSNITKIPFAFKPEPSLNLIPTLYFEIRFPIIIINGYGRKANVCSPWTSCYCCIITLNFFLHNRKNLGTIIKVTCFKARVTLAFRLNFKVIISCRTHRTSAC